jgi:hypothetical protein
VQYTPNTLECAFFFFALSSLGNAAFPVQTFRVSCYQHFDWNDSSYVLFPRTDYVYWSRVTTAMCIPATCISETTEGPPFRFIWIQTLYSPMVLLWTTKCNIHKICILYTNFIICFLYISKKNSPHFLIHH